MIPLADDWKAFADRFGMTVWTLFNMTEINCPIVSGADPATPGTCGRQRPGVDLRIVDANDCEVPAGTVGELILRSDAPWSLNSGYFKDPEATARAWRNGWFHTGDAFRRDAQGNYFFVDRMKDAIRRRGENISSFEVEVEIIAHPKVRECAVVAVPNETSEDDVLAIVAPTPGETIDPGRTARVPAAPPGALHAAALRARAAGPAAHAHAEGREARAAQRRRHCRHLGPGEGRGAGRQGTDQGLSPADCAALSRAAAAPACAAAPRTSRGTSARCRCSPRSPPAGA